ncbi:hypothetical protein [Streptomyces sp. NPDC060205]|uniref:hypothetical protein n=1 Tax=Streptomyces sp. NPDC060205 TaxID=3347072 RepID=UPI00364B8019
MDIDQTIEQFRTLAAAHENPGLRESGSMSLDFWRTLDNIFNFVGEERLRAMKEQWKTLRDEVRPRRLEVESRWDFDQMLVHEEHFVQFCEIYQRLGNAASRACNSPHHTNYLTLRTNFRELTESAITTWRSIETTYPSFGIVRA